MDERLPKLGDVLRGAVLLVTLLAAAPRAEPTGLAGIHYHAPPPNFTVAQTGEARYLWDLHGRVVIVNFWASWCDACTAELPYFADAQRTFGDRVALVTVSDEAHGVAAAYLRKAGLALPLVEDISGAIDRVYSIAKIPDTLVLDPSGEVTYVSVGGLSWPELRDAVERALGG